MFVIRAGHVPGYFDDINFVRLCFEMAQTDFWNR